jgi:hypothetical protein
MAFRLSDLIIAGFFVNPHRFSTHGRLLLRGAEMPVAFELTGAPCADLGGRTLEFEVPENDHEASDKDRRLATEFKPHQIGVTGDMTAERKVRTFDCSIEEFNRRAALGEPPPTRWEDCLYLEWFSQNGRVVIELPISKVRFLSETEIAARNKAEAESFEIETLKLDEECETGEPEIIRITPEGGIDPPDLLSQPGNEDDEGYGLIPDELESELARKARRTDREVAGEPEDSINTLEEMELMDEMLEKGTRTPLMEFLADLNLPSPAAVLTDGQAEQSLKMALTKLALAGVAFHVCEHCTAREAYRIFIEDVCSDAEDSGAFRPLIGTGWVQNFCSSDYCKQCGEDEPLSE